MTVLGALGLEERIGKNFIPQSSHCPAARALEHITSLLKHLQEHRSPYAPPAGLEIKLPTWGNASPPASPASLSISPPPSPWTLTHAAALLSQVVSYLSAFSPAVCHALLVFICFVLPYPCCKTLLRYHFLPAFSRPFPSAERGSILIPLRSPSPSPQ